MTRAKVKTWNDFQVSQATSRRRPKYEPPVLCVGDLVVNTPADVAAVLCPLIGKLEQEHFVVLALNRMNRVVEADVLSIGTDVNAVVDPRNIFRWALTRREPVCQIILVHNHPSGNETASPEDIEVTNRMRDAGKLLGIAILDHLVIAEERYCSIAEREVHE